MPTNLTRPVLRAKLRSLRDDISQWAAIAEDKQHQDHPIFAKHQSQILRLRDLFVGMTQVLQAKIDSVTGEQVAADAEAISANILQGHSLWAYFRDKLLMRYSPARKHLAAADEFAWDCFEPLYKARRAVAPVVSKTPPLIFLGRDVSPLVYPRDWSLENQVPDVADDLFSKLTKRAPFSVVNLPYYQATHLSETMVLAHEMGHVADLDLGLAPGLDGAFDQAVKTLPKERREAWKCCRVEAFADVFGAHAAGVAFCSALSSFLSKDRATIVDEVIDTGTLYAYPTVYLRMLLVLQVLKHNSTFNDHAKAIEDDWKHRYGEEHQCAEFAADLPQIVTALLDTPLAELGNQPLKGVLACWSAKEEKRIAKAAQNMLLHGVKPKTLDEAMMAFAAATLAFHKDPQAYVDQDVEGKVLSRIKDISTDEVRSASRAYQAAPEVDNNDRLAGADLADSMFPN